MADAVLADRLERQGAVPAVPAAADYQQDGFLDASRSTAPTFVNGKLGERPDDNHEPEAA